MTDELCANPAHADQEPHTHLSRGFFQCSTHGAGDHDTAACTLIAEADAVADELSLMLSQIRYVAGFDATMLSDDGCDALSAAADLLSAMTSHYQDGPGALTTWLNDETEFGATALARQLSCEGPSTEVATILETHGWA